MVVNPNRGNLLLVECKAPSVKIDQQVFDQIARYNLEAKSQYMMPYQWYESLFLHYGLYESAVSLY